MTDFTVTIDGSPSAVITVGDGFDVQIRAGHPKLQSALTDELTSEREVRSGEEADGGVYDEVELLIPVDDPYALQMALLGLPMQLSELYPNMEIDVDGDWDVFTAGEEKHLAGRHDQMTHAGEEGPRSLAKDEKEWYDASHAADFGLSEPGFAFILDRMSEGIKDRAHLIQTPGDGNAQYVLNVTGVPPGTKEFTVEGWDDVPRILSGRLLEQMSGVFGGALTETLSTGEFPDAAWEYVESIIEPRIKPVRVPISHLAKVMASWKHLPAGRDDMHEHEKLLVTVDDVNEAGVYLNKPVPADEAMQQYMVDKTGDQPTASKVYTSLANWHMGKSAYEFAGAYALGANTSLKFPLGDKELPSLTESEVKAFQARTACAQAFFRQRYGVTATAYRGVHLAQAKQVRQAIAQDAETIDIKQYGLSSWTMKESDADFFAYGRTRQHKGVVLASEISYRDIYIVTGLGPRAKRFRDDDNEVVLINPSLFRSISMVRAK